MRSLLSGSLFFWTCSSQALCSLITLPDKGKNDWLVVTEKKGNFCCSALSSGKHPQSSEHDLPAEVDQFQQFWRKQRSCPTHNPLFWFYPLKSDFTVRLPKQHVTLCCKNPTDIRTNTKPPESAEKV